MCHTIACSVCGKTTWDGCGQHIEEALQGIPDAQRCAGHDSATATFPAFFPAR
jgi:hypothetical protein